MTQNIIEAIEQEAPESPSLEYKSTDAHPSSIVRELVAFANKEGGTVIVGVKEEDGKLVKIQSVENPSGLEEQLQESISSTVEPLLDIDFTQYTYDGKRIVSVSVDSSNLLCSHENNKPNFPIRQGSTTTYLHGLNLARAYSGEEPDLTGIASVTQESEPQPELKPWLQQTKSEGAAEDTVLLMYYAEHFESKDEFTKEYIENLFQRACVSPPENIHSVMHDLSEKGWTMQTAIGEEARWVLTLQGIEHAKRVSRREKTAEKRRSLAEFRRVADNPMKRDLALLVGWYLEYQDGQDGFTKTEVEEKARDARIQLGANVSRDISMQEDDGKLIEYRQEGEDVYRLSIAGEDYVENKILDSEPQSTKKTLR